MRSLRFCQGVETSISLVYIEMLRRKLDLIVECVTYNRDSVDRHLPNCSRLFQRLGLDMIFQEMMVPGPITPLKADAAPFTFPGGQVSFVVPVKKM